MAQSIELTLFAHLVGRPDEEIDVPQAALLLATSEYPLLDVSLYVDSLTQLGEETRERLGDTRGTKRIERLLACLYGELGFHGNEADYYDPKNSFLNDVLDRRTGIPISLAVILVEVCRHARLAARGVSFPGHFLVRIPLREGVVVIDPFTGTALGRQELRALHARATGVDADPDPRLLAPATNRQILARMLNNLRGVYTARKDHERLTSVIGYLDVLGEGQGTRTDTAATRGRWATPGGHALN